MSEYFEFHNPVKIMAGRKALDNIPDYLRTLHSERPLILTDKGVEAAGLLSILLNAFAESGITIGAVFTDTPPDSSTATVTNAAAVYRAKDCDAIIAIGGGSVIDTAKGVNILVSLGGDDLMAYAGVGAVDRKLNSFIVVPTTAGTGSEVTLVAVIMDTERRQKLLFVSPFVLPDAAVIDPRMTLTLPPGITAATGMDALTHAVEAFTCLGKNPLSDAYAITAIRTIVAKLEAAIASPSDAGIRLELATAATCAGVAFSNSMVGLVHSLGHATGAVCHVHHGVAMNVFLPYVLRYNLAAIEESLAELAVHLADPAACAALPRRERAELAIRSIEALRDRLWNSVKLPRRLSETGKVGKDQFPAIAKAAINDASIACNRAEADYDDCLSLLETAW